MPVVPVPTRQVMPSGETFERFRTTQTAPEATALRMEAGRHQFRASQIRRANSIVQDVLGLTSDIVELRVASEFDQARYGAETEIDTFMEGLEFDPAYETYREKLENIKQETYEKWTTPMKSRLAKQRFDAWWGQKGMDWEASVDLSATTREVGHHKAVREQLIDAGIKEGDKGFVEELINEGLAIGIYHRDEAVELWGEAAPQADVELGRLTSRRILAQTGDMKEVANYLYGADRPELMTDKDADKLYNEAKALNAEELARQAAARREEIRTINLDFVQKNAAGALGVQEVLDSNLEPTGTGSKDWWLNKLEQDAKDKESGKVPKTPEAVKLEAIDIVLDPTLTPEQKQERILALRDKGMTGDDVWKWHQRVNVDQVPELKVGYQMIKDAVKEFKLDKTIEAQLMVDLEAEHDRQIDDVRGNPDKVRDIAQVLIDRETAKVARSWLDKNTYGLAGKELTEKVREEKLEEVELRAEALGLEPEEEIVEVPARREDFAEVYNRILDREVADEDILHIRSREDPDDERFSLDGGRTWYRVKGKRLEQLQADGTWQRVKRQRTGRSR